jgi:hypothetical protein
MIDSILIPRNRDDEDVPQVRIAQWCECGLEAALVSFDTMEWPDNLGYLNCRIRMVYQCQHCHRTHSFRLGGKKIVNGKVVHQGDTK